jgi:predicted RNA-binding protein with EMAP domain
MCGEVQSILFNNKKYTSTTAKAWLTKHNVKPIKPVHKTIDNLRYRILDPKKFKSFKTKKLNNNITLILGTK